MWIYKNKVLSSKHSVTTEDTFCNYLHWGHKSDNMTPKAFKAWFEALMKLYKNHDANFEPIIGEKKQAHCINAFSNENCNVFVQQQKVLKNDTGGLCKFLPDLLHFGFPPMQTMQTWGCCKMRMQWSKPRKRCCWKEMPCYSMQNLVESRW